MIETSPCEYAVRGRRRMDWSEPDWPFGRMVMPPSDPSLCWLKLAQHFNTGSEMMNSSKSDRTKESFCRP